MALLHRESAQNTDGKWAVKAAVHNCANRSDPPHPMQKGGFRHFTEHLWQAATLYTPAQKVAGKGLARAINTSATSFVVLQV